MNGKKTYVLAFIGVIWAIAGFLLGYLDTEQAGMVLWSSLTVASLRHGIEKIEK